LRASTAQNNVMHVHGVVVAVHAWPAEFTQSRPVQHATVVEHDCPRPGHVAFLQVPVVEPAGIAHCRPEQQSAVAVQTPFNG
jgi:hypothetical protein